MISFKRTLRSLHADQPRQRIEWVVLLVLVGWIAWMSSAKVPVYEASDKARLEVSRAAHALSSGVLGRVVVSHLQLGRQVEEGDVLVELDAIDAELAVREKQARIASLQSRRTAIEREVAAEQTTLVAQRQAREQSTVESRAQITRVTSQLKYAEAELNRHKQLRESKSVAQAEYEKIQSLAEGTALAKND